MAEVQKTGGSCTVVNGIMDVLVLLSFRCTGTAAFVDAEHALDPVYAVRIRICAGFMHQPFLLQRNLGVDVDELLCTQPDCGEMALDVVDKLVRSSAVDIIVVDSVAALVPRG